MDTISEVTQALIQFRDERDWAQFHNAKDLALGLSIEAAELNELFLWKQSDEVNRDRLKEELADVFNYCLLIAEQQGLDLREIALAKIQQNARKYPVDKSKGSSRKYTEL
ncbi:nucleotide pyrophosphohydrolase [Pontibacter sp. G13]|uniref:nucleotide pyrophosphohydrolase n=1 Tax=Pontibacter sp. G13 TaxID=3074898 RepID=UPI00288B0A7D|nr:nucleotide pyrophosphohydrolase [Pontibacter sp. G13]WNJ21205.1 nucleotide pyrophosphohydrolase [Pontibacter sp. G13]